MPGTDSGTSHGAAPAGGAAAAARRIQDSGVIAILRLDQPDRAADVAQALVDGGIRALEITMTVPGAVRLIGGIGRRMPPGVLFGAGTVLDTPTAAGVIDAGARFVVSPSFDPAVLETCHRAGVLAVPGCLTPTEIVNAWRAGALLVKLFPASSLGPGYLRELRAPLPQVALVPTGGITASNAGEWLAAGAAALGVGSALTPAAAIAAGRYEVLTAAARQLVDAVGTARREPRP